MRKTIQRTCFDSFKLLVVGLGVSAFALSGQAALPAGAVAVVNGVAISQAQLDEALAAQVARGRKDEPALRASLRQELIHRELLAQAAIKAGLDKSPQAQMLLDESRQGVLIGLLVRDDLAKSPITQAQIRAEYDRQIAALGDLSKTKEYLLKIIAVDTEAVAKDVITRLRNGESFDKLARELSKDASAQQGGQLGWLRINQLVPAVGQVVEKARLNTLIPTPIQANAGWNVIRLDDVRPLQPFPYERAKGPIERELVQQRRAALVRALLESAKVEQE
jgi:peptidyl-prolyl cis-trans isomerase C